MDGMGKTNGVAEGFDKKELEAWLRTQPVEVSVVLAARSALRVMPMLRTAAETGRDGPDTVLLPLFRGMATPCGLLQKRGYHGATMAAARQSAKAAMSASDLTAVGSLAPSASADAIAVSANAAVTLAQGELEGRTCALASKAIRAAEAAAFIAATNAASGALKASGRPVLANAFAFPAFGAAITYDRRRLASGASPLLLFRDPLWPTGMPRELGVEWLRLTSYLLSRNEDWEIWTDWYEDRLAGRPPEAKLDRARIMLPDGLWKQGAKAVNAELKRIRADLQAEGAEDPKAETGNPQGSSLSESGQEGTGQEPNWHEVVKQCLRDEAPVSAVIEDGRIAGRDSPPDAKPPIDHPEDLQARLLGLRMTADKVLATLGEMPHNLGPYLARDIGHFLQVVSQSPPVWYALDDAAACLRDQLRLIEVPSWPSVIREDVERLVRRTEELRPLLQPQQPEPAPAASEKPPLELDPEKATSSAVGEILSQVEGAIRADGGRVLAPSAQQTLKHYTDEAREALASPDTSEASEAVRQRRLIRALKGIGGFAARATENIAVVMLTVPEAASTLMIRFETIWNAIARLFA